MGWPSIAQLDTVDANDILVLLGCALNSDLGTLRAFINRADTAIIRSDDGQLTRYWRDHLLTTGVSLLVSSAAPGPLLHAALDAAISNIVLNDPLLEWPGSRNRWKLPPREAQSLWFTELLSTRQAARYMGVGHDTVKRQRHNAIEKIRRQYGAYRPPEAYRSAA